jgi:hypothetical protein
MFVPMDLPEFTSSLQTLDLAKAWVENCISDHPQCQSADELFVPKRLIEILTGDSGSVQIRLRETAGEEVRYVTLSHCWGNHIPLRLLKGNMAKMKEEINYQQLSRVFQDAILVAIYLRVDYIWIDSLCIIQDCEQDWIQEATQMITVYSSSYCNISATAASNSLFVRRHPRHLLPVEKTIRGEPRYIYSNNLWKNEIELSPLNERGWVCQERLLSPRNLHFGASQLFWECDTCSNCEISPIRMNPHEPSPALRLNPILREVGCDSEFHTRVYDTWDSIVGMYSKAKLTKERDKLIAISGIAKKLGPIVNDRYLAGLWLRPLVSQLLWFVKPEEIVYRPKIYVAPSWSWASVIGPVYSDYSVDMAEWNLLNIEAVEMSYVDGNPYGLVKSGEIKIQGRLAKANICGRFCRQDKPDGSFEYYIDGIAKEVVDIYAYRDATSIKGERIERIHDTDSNIYCLPVHESLGVSHVVRGLLLRPTGISPCQFQRFGYFFTESNAATNATFEACRSFDKTTEASSFSSIQDDEGNRKYTTETSSYSSLQGDEGNRKYIITIV